MPVLLADELRAEAQFVRSYDGHVWVQTRKKEWYEVSTPAVTQII
jgi:hypothetical protein